MATYEITEPPGAKQCDTYECGHTATVRLISPREMVSQIGSDDPLTEDQCCLCGE